MRCSARVFGLGSLAIVVGSVSGVVAASETGLHLALEKSSPAEDAVLDSAPTEIRLFFSQEPQAAGTSLRLMAADSTRVSTGDPEPSADDTAVFSAPVTGAMPDGSYTVVWRAMAKDGHVVRGEFSFTLVAADGAPDR
jgi:methionine-rich copper-binding protein CopC